MKDYLISMFVDNELNLDEKIEFVESVHNSEPMKDETVELLQQEKMLQGEMTTAIPAVSLPVQEKKILKIPFWFNPLVGFATAILLVAGIFFFQPSTVTGPEELQHRFVIYRPDISQANIVGDFTRWSPVAMEKIGDSGYWAITLKLPEGEHRYSYLVNKEQQIADPTVLSQEQDDFGGKNTVINVALAI